MDYENFRDEYDKYMDWGKHEPKDVKRTKKSLYDAIFEVQEDRVNQPSHYTAGKTEAIDIIEDAIKDSPNVEAGFLQGQVLKYLLRIWLKDNPLEDAKKARWYLNRLIDKLT